MSDGPTPPPLTSASEQALPPWARPLVPGVALFVTFIAVSELADLALLDRVVLAVLVALVTDAVFLVPDHVLTGWSRFHPHGSVLTLLLGVQILVVVALAGFDAPMGWPLLAGLLEFVYAIAVGILIGRQSVLAAIETDEQA